MSRYTGPLGVGDVLVTREGPWWVSGVIRLGAKLMGRPAIGNHVIVVHHRDETGTLWGIEGRPGGVGWRDLSRIAEHPLTNANTEQPKTEEQRYLVGVAIESLLGRPYDWAAISAAARQSMRLWHVVRADDWQDGEVPAHVICSALADWAYEQVGLPSPNGTTGTRFTTPGCWDKFILDHQWEQEKR